MRGDEDTEGEVIHILPSDRFGRLGKLVSEMGQVWEERPLAKGAGGIFKLGKVPVQKLLSRPEVIEGVEKLGRKLLKEMNLKDEVEVADEVGHNHF